ncbi:MAG: 3-deoxy-manno-octulosonate cytidylyltransferase [Deltaproteobacteria bacterium]|uniref:3-deoxy-manno-octulosonate cytidylyltransferase n=1 Tax=Candidatus Zymogenus saltonus TaxID=2844893 RepID=A0A9D8PN14_9DELT|nr:3-deoxy-manno-octulosonate cytidylyltransferase [Candidatus Zymogenus saltonus]
MTRKFLKGFGGRSVAHVVAVIPARYDSVRFPGKVLALLDGRPIIEHVARRTAAAKTVNRIIVATDDRRIADRITDSIKVFGAEVVMTSREHRTGTDRIGEAVENIRCDIVVNVQGDEAAIEPRAIDDAVRPLIDEPDLEMSTLSADIKEEGDLLSPNVVKVVIDKRGYALYFSRSPIPFCRDNSAGGKMRFNPSSSLCKKHIGLYVFRRDFLDKYIRLPMTPLERAESLEQLRVLENGYRIKVINTEYDFVGVDSPEDLERLENLVREGRLIL